jgi:drug/metabolite transporter (DMT)-like permease
MGPRKNIDALATGLMALLCTIWGFQQIIMKITVPDVPPIFQVALRTTISGFFVIILVRVRGGRIIPRDGTLAPGVVLAFLYAMEFVFIGEALVLTSASRLTIFIYTAPVFAAIGLHIKLPEERLERLQWLGVAMAFAGVIIAFSSSGAGETKAQYPHMLKGDLFGLAGGLFWGISTVLIRCSKLAYAPPTTTLLYHLAGGALFLGPLALATGQASFKFTALALGSMFFQTVLVAFMCFMIWTWLLRNYLASPLGVLSFMTPIFGVIFAVILLDDPLPPGFVAGSLLVLGGMIIVNGYKSFVHQLHKRRHDHWNQSGS